MRSEDEVLAHVARRLPGARASRATRLTGGHLNYVWRIAAEPESLIVKWAPPFVAALPDVPLDADRILFEARSLALFGPDGRLTALCSNRLRVPTLIDVDVESKALIMEDLGALADLGECLRRGRIEAGWGQQLGKFIGELHAHTAGDAGIAAAFDNATVQRTRLNVQYRAVESLLTGAGIDAPDTVQRASELGERLTLKGICLTMGDLWPASILVDGPRLRLIDWEFAHFGRPAQDVGHLLAHLWMHAHCNRNTEASRRTEELAREFRDSYLRAAEPAARKLIDADFHADCQVHMGAEIVMRTIGPFRSGSLYEDFAPESSHVRHALSHAIACMGTSTAPQ